MISVIMATYNGVNYVAEQIDSILCQLDSGDELIITDDGSVDGTKEVIERFATRDSRIKPLSGSNRGVAVNFEFGLNACAGDVIFLSDQDDVWFPDKVQRVLMEFNNTGAVTIIHDAAVTDEKLKIMHPSFFAWHGFKQGYWGNIVRNSFIGCCMAFKRELLEFILPFPRNVPMHDQWIGLISYQHGKVHFLDEPLINYRRHAYNASSTDHAPIVRMLTWRICLVWALFMNACRRSLSKRKTIGS